MHITGGVAPGLDFRRQVSEDSIGVFPARPFLDRTVEIRIIASASVAVLESGARHDDTGHVSAGIVGKHWVGGVDVPATVAFE